MKLRLGGCTHQGTVRNENQDGFLTGGRLIQLGEAEELADWPVDNLRWVAVADGMGGHDEGRLASRMVLEAVASIHEAEQEDVQRTLSSLHREMVSRGNLGSTLTAIALKGTRVSLVHVGDSRLYRYVEGYLTLLTHDDAEESQGRTLLTACIGGGVLEPLQWTWMDTVGFEPGCRFLLCTDGLTAVLSAEKIEEIIRQNMPSPEWRLVEAAVGAGAPDNVTALVVEFVKE